MLSTLSLDEEFQQHLSTLDIHIRSIQAYVQKNDHSNAEREKKTAISQVNEIEEGLDKLIKDFRSKKDSSRDKNEIADLTAKISDIRTKLNTLEDERDRVLNAFTLEQPADNPIIALTSQNRTASSHVSAPSTSTDGHKQRKHHHSSASKNQADSSDSPVSSISADSHKHRKHHRQPKSSSGKQASKVVVETPVPVLVPIPASTPVVSTTSTSARGSKKSIHHSRSKEHVNSHSSSKKSTKKKKGLTEPSTQKPDSVAVVAPELSKISDGKFNFFQASSPELHIDPALKAERGALWACAPFRDMNALCLAYQATQKGGTDSPVSSSSTSSDPSTTTSHTVLTLSEEELKDFIIKCILKKMKTSPLTTMQQGLVLAGIKDPEIIQGLFGLILERIQAPGYAAAEDYMALRQLLSHIDHKLLQPNQLTALTNFINTQMNNLLAPDIFLSCQLVQSMAYTLQLALLKEDMQILEHHQDRMRQTMYTLQSRLAKLINKTTTAAQTNHDKKGEYEIELITNLNKAINEILSALTQGHIPDERTQRERYVGRILQCGALLVQAAEVGAQCYTAAASFGLSAAGTLTSAVGLLGNVVDSTKRVYHYYKDNQGYFNALIEWHKAFNQSDDANKQVLIGNLIAPTSSVDDHYHKYHQHPGFIEGVLQVVMANYRLLPALQSYIIISLHRLFSRLNNQPIDEGPRLKQQISYYLMKIDEFAKKDISAGGVPYPATDSSIQITNEAFINNVLTTEDKALYVRENKDFPAKPWSENLALSAWRQRYPGDGWLFNFISEVGLDHPRQLLPADADTLRKLAATVPPPGYAMSAWGKAVIKSYGRLPEVYPAVIDRIANFSYKSSLTVHETNMSFASFKAAAHDPEVKQLTSDFYNSTIDKSFAAADTFKLNPELQAQKIQMMTEFFTKNFQLALQIPMNSKMNFEGFDGITLGKFNITDQEVAPSESTGTSYTPS